MANFRAKTFSFKNVDKAREPLNLHFGLGIPRHVGRSKVREHSLELEVLERKRCADVVKVFGIKAVAVHASVNSEMSLAFCTSFTKELVKGHCSADVGNGCRELVFNKVRKVRRCARTKHENRQVHAVLAKQHAFADVGDTEIVGTTELGCKRAGEASVAVRVGLDGEQNFCRSRNLASDKLNVVAESV